MFKGSKNDFLPLYNRFLDLLYGKFRHLIKKYQLMKKHLKQSMK